MLSVYAAGYARTKSAADRIEGPAGGARPAVHMSAVPVAPTPDGSVLPAPPPAAAAAALPAPVTATSLARGATVSPPVPASAPVLPAPAAAVAEPAPDPAIVAAKLAAAPPWKDGTYDGWGTCRHGDIQATVVIEAGRIASATITQCLTRYSCDIIEKLPPEVSQRQSPEVDYVSGATQSAGAFYWAVVGALGKAK